MQQPKIGCNDQPQFLAGFWRLYQTSFDFMHTFKLDCHSSNDDMLDRWRKCVVFVNFKKLHPIFQVELLSCQPRVTVMSCFVYTC